MWAPARCGGLPAGCRSIRRQRAALHVALLAFTCRGRPSLANALLLFPHRHTHLLQLPYLVSNIVEVLDVDPEEEEEEDGERWGRAAGGPARAPGWVGDRCRSVQAAASWERRWQPRPSGRLPAWPLAGAPTSRAGAARCAALPAGAGAYQDASKKGKCVVLKTSTRQTVFLPVAGLVDPETLKPGDLVGVNKDSYLILDTLPAEYDSR